MPKAAFAWKSIAWDAIKDYGAIGRVKENLYPSDPPRGKLPFPEKVNQEAPVNVVKSSFEVDLKKCRSLLRSVKMVSENMGAAKVFEEISTLDEGSLVGVDQVCHIDLQSRR